MKLLIVLCMLLLSFAAPAIAADAPLLSFDRVSISAFAVNEWSRVTGEDIEDNGFFAGLGPSYNLLYPTALNPNGPNLSIISSFAWGLDQEEFRVRAGFSYLFPIGGGKYRGGQ
jgi:hypothetical protein